MLCEELGGEAPGALRARSQVLRGAQVSSVPLGARSPTRGAPPQALVVSHLGGLGSPGCRAVLAERQGMLTEDNRRDLAEPPEGPGRAIGPGREPSAN